MKRLYGSSLAFLVSLAVSWLATDRWMAAQQPSQNECKVHASFHLLGSRQGLSKAGLDRVPETIAQLAALGHGLTYLSEEELLGYESEVASWKSPSMQELVAAMIKEERALRNRELPPAALAMSLVSYFKGELTLEKLPQAIQRLLSREESAIFSAKDRFGDPLVSRLGISRIFNSLALLDPDKAVETALSISDVDRRHEAVSAVVREMAEQDPEVAFQILLRLPNERGRSQIGRRVFQGLLMRDPAAAVGHAQQLQDLGINLDFPDRALTQAWFRKDPDAAITWLESKPVHESSMLYESGIMGLLNESRFEEAVDLLPRVAEPHRLSAINRIASDWGYVDLENAEAWAYSLEDEAARMGALSGVASAASSRDVDKGWQLVRELAAMELGRSTSTQLARTVYELEVKAPGMLQREPWFQSWLEDSGNEVSLDQLAQSTSRYIPTFSATLLEYIPPDKQADHARRTASSWAEVDPVTASRWVESLDPGETQFQAAHAVAQEWERYDNQAAKAWLSQFSKE